MERVQKKNKQPGERRGQKENPRSLQRGGGPDPVEKFAKKSKNIGGRPFEEGGRVAEMLKKKPHVEVAGGPHEI